MAKKILAWSDSAQQYYREIGKREDGRPMRFYLGAVEKLAVANVARLEALWKGVEDRWEQWYLDDPHGVFPFPCWDGVTIQLGKAVGKGEYTIQVEFDDDHDDLELARRIAEMRMYFPMIQVTVVDEDSLQQGMEYMREMAPQLVEEEAERHQRNMGNIKNVCEGYGGKVPTKETLYDALDAYKEWIEKEFVDVTGRTTQTGVKQGERADRIKRHVKDIRLSDFDIPEIEAVIDYWRKRPKKPDYPQKSPKKEGKQQDRPKKEPSPYSFTICKHTIRLFKHFLKWLHKNPAFPWKRPIDLELDRIKIVQDKETKIAVDVYTKEELRTLWTHATLIERQFILLALNCGFSISEIGTLDWTMVHGDYIKRIRPKTKVYGEFLLWDITKEALGEPKKKGLVFTTENGIGLIEPTKTNKRGAKIPNTWYRLLNRIKKFEQGFKRLGFHHLRKTSGNLMRQFSDGETMAVHLCHGKPVKTDALAGLYSNPFFPKVFEAQRRVHDYLAEIFTPLNEVELPRKISPATIRQIRSMKKNGIKTAKIAEVLGVTVQTVRRYAKSPSSRRNNNKPKSFS
jgi:integrase